MARMSGDEFTVLIEDVQQPADLENVVMKLLATMRESLVVALGGSLIFALLGYGLGLAFGFSARESLVIGLAMMFSSTVIGIKLLPTTTLHHRHTWELVISMLLLQDLLAILVLILLSSGWEGGQTSLKLLLALAGTLPLLIFFAFAAVRLVLLKLIARFDRFHEYIFLLAIGWCLGLAELGHLLGLPSEVGAFVAGVALASHPISLYISQHFKPLRDFFLVLFFFSIGARFELGMLQEILVPVLLLTALMLALKPLVYRWLLRSMSESRRLAWEVGFRLGQTSEFSLLIAYLAVSTAWIGSSASHLIQATTILTFLFSSYIVIFNYPTPIAVSDRLRRD